MTEWIADLIGRGGMLGVFVLTLLESVFPPLPAEVIMPMAGVAAARGDLSLAAAIVAGTAGAMAGNMFWFLVARRVGTARIEAWVDRHGRWLTLDRAELDRVRGWFEHRGGWAVGLGRCLPTMRTLISVPAGLAGMSASRFLLWSTLGTAVWTTFLTWIGFALGQSAIPEISRWLGPVALGIAALGLLTYFVRLATWRRR